MFPLFRQSLQRLRCGHDVRSQCRLCCHKQLQPSWRMATSKLRSGCWIRRRTRPFHQNGQQRSWETSILQLHPPRQMRVYPSLRSFPVCQSLSQMYAVQLWHSQPALQAAQMASDHSIFATWYCAVKAVLSFCVRWQLLLLWYWQEAVRPTLLRFFRGALACPKQEIGRSTAYCHWLYITPLGFQMRKLCRLWPSADLF